MTNKNGRPHRYRPAGAKSANGGASTALAYSPTGTGCPAVEEAIEELYRGQSEESFWTLVSALNYALQMETRVLVPAQTAASGSSRPGLWSLNPIPAEKADSVPLWTLRTEKGQCWLPLFTSAAGAVSGEATANRPMVEKTMQDAMQLALDSPEIDGVVLNPWTRSATLDAALVGGLLKAPRGTDEPGEDLLDEGRKNAAEGHWSAAAGNFDDAAAAGSTAALTLLGECFYYGRGRRRSRTEARSLWRQAAEAGEINAILDLGDDCADPGAALRFYRRAQQLARLQPDIEYSPRVALRIAQTELRHLSGKRTLAVRMCAEAAHGFRLLAADGVPDAAQWQAEAEALAAELGAEDEILSAYKKSLQMD